MIIAGLVDMEEIDVIDEIIKVSSIGSRIRDLSSVEAQKTKIENKLLQEQIINNLIEEYLDDVCYQEV